MTPEEAVAMANKRWEEDFSFAQRATLFIVPIVAGSLSVFGSASILYMLYKRGSRKRLPDRLMACMSSADVFVSTWIVFGGLAVPKETGGAMAIGSWGTCEASAFFTNFVYSVGTYNVCLLLYSLFRIRYSWREEKIVSRMEKYMHFVAIAFPSATGIWGLLHDAFNPVPMGFRRCFPVAYPPNCRKRGDCTRPKGEYTGVVLNTIPNFLLVIIFLVILFLIYTGARQTYSKSQSTQYLDAGGNTTTSSSQQIQIDAGTTSKKNHNNNNKTKKEKKSKNMIAMRNQSILYGIFFFFTFMSSVLLTMVLFFRILVTDSGGKPQPYALVLYFELTWPLQGFFNFVIFSRPRYQRIRTARWDQSRWWAMKETFFGEQLSSMKYRRPMVQQQLAPSSGERKGDFTITGKDQTQVMRPALQEEKVNDNSIDDTCNNYDSSLTLLEEQKRILMSQDHSIVFEGDYDSDDDDGDADAMMATAELHEDEDESSKLQQGGCFLHPPSQQRPLQSSSEFAISTTSTIDA